MSKNGKIVQVIGAVVDAAFPQDSVPEIYDAITIAFAIGGVEKNLTLEVQQHLGDGLVRAVAMTSTDGLVRGMEVVGTGTSISVPVGEAVLGRIFNVTGDTVDEKDQLQQTSVARFIAFPPSLLIKQQMPRSSRLASRSSILSARSLRAVKWVLSVVRVWVRPLSSWS